MNKIIIILWIVMSITIMGNFPGCAKELDKGDGQESEKAEKLAIGGGYKTPGKELILDEDFEEYLPGLFGENQWQRVNGTNGTDFQIVDAMTDKESYIAGNRSLKVGYSGSQSSFKYPFNCKSKTIRILFIPRAIGYGGKNGSDVLTISLCDKVGKKGPVVCIKRQGNETLLYVPTDKSRQMINITPPFFTSDGGKNGYISPYRIQYNYPIILYCDLEKRLFMVRNGNNENVLGSFGFTDGISEFASLCIENGNNSQAVCYLDQILMEGDVLSSSDIDKIEIEKRGYGLSKVNADDGSFDISAKLNIRERSFKIIPEANIPAELNIRKEDLPSRPQWINDAIIYQTPIIGASGEGTIQGLIMRIPEIKQLGVNVLYLTPVHVNNMGPYAVKDYFSVNPRFGNKENFRELVRVVHANGMRIIIDLVPLHTAQNNPLLREHPEYYELKDGKFWSEWKNMCKLDYTNPNVWKYMSAVGVYWVKEFDVDGYRCDVAAGVPEDFWRYFKKSISDAKKDVILLQEGTAPGLYRNGFDLGYNHKGLVGQSSIGRGMTHEELVDSIIYDLSINGSDLDKRMLRANILENHDYPPAIETLGLKYSKSLMTFICTIPGIPLIAWGQEIGNRNYYAIGGEKDEKLLSFYTSLFKLRNQNEVLRYGEIKRIPLDNPDVVAYTRAYNNKKVFVIINFSGIPYHTNIPVNADFLVGKSEITDQLSEKRFTVDQQNHTVSLSLDSYGGVIFLGK